MKQSVVILILIILGGNLLFSQVNKEAYSYLSTILNDEEQISKRFLSFASSVAHSNSARKVENRRKDLIKSVMEVKSKISKMNCLDNDCSLRDSLISFLQLDYYVLNSDFEKILNMEEVAEESYDLMEAYLNARAQANNKVQKKGEMLDELYKTFAVRHDVTISDRKDILSIQIEKVNRVNEHYEIIYLIFFKAYKQEAYLINALNKKDFSGAEQNRNALQQVSLEGLGKLDTIKTFQNDRSLISACRRSLEFYKMEAQDKISDVIDYILKNDNYNKLTQTVGSKDPMFRTKDEVDQYNESIKELNVATRKYNSINQILNQQRSSSVNEWNLAVQNFFEKYVPNYNY